MQKGLYLVSVLLTISFNGSAQLKINGQVTDENRNPIAFASVGIENTPIGTICNAEGNFELVLKGEITKPIVISHLGYESRLIGLDDFKGLKNIVLKEAIVQLQEVRVTTLNAKGMIEIAIDRIEDNYEFNPTTYTIYTSNKHFINDSPAYIMESIAEMYRDRLKVDKIKRETSFKGI
ncbi:carboxypeptidase-like regulatory domain-containing protein [Ekhidna sp.]